jgi:hypothetical protein
MMIFPPARGMLSTRYKKLALTFLNFILVAAVFDGSIHFGSTP